MKFVAAPGAVRVISLLFARSSRALAPIVTLSILLTPELDDAAARGSATAASFTDPALTLNPPLRTYVTESSPALSLASVPAPFTVPACTSKPLVLNDPPPAVTEIGRPVIGKELKTLSAPPSNVTPPV